MRKICIIIGLIIVITCVAELSAAPVRWEVSSGGNGHYYDVIPVSEGLTWSAANATAQSMAGDWHLVTITSAAENAFVFDLIDDDANLWNCCLSGHSNGPWIGGYKENRQWKWVTGEAFAYENWGPREPFGNGDKISFFGYSTLIQPYWNDVPDSYPGLPPRGYVIETELIIGCPHPVGHLDYCRDCGPCADGDGDCDNNTECESGLTCVQVLGTDTCQSICDIPIGHLDYCRDCGPCAEGEGDCDSDSECQNGLTCVQVVGTDTCQASAPVCPHPVGHLDYCKDCGPCAEAEGDCDSDSECEPGLTCVQVTGPDTCQSECTVPVGHLDYCLKCGPCSSGEGDCDNDSECQSGLSCVQVTGTDVCCPHPIGHLDYCRDCGPCGAGQGDCDNDGECQSGLTCVQVTGTDTCQ
jgi:hypothetical protein